MRFIFSGKSVKYLVVRVKSNQTSNSNTEKPIIKGNVQLLLPINPTLFITSLLTHLHTSLIPSSLYLYNTTHIYPYICLSLCQKTILLVESFWLEKPNKANFLGTTWEYFLWSLLYINLLLYFSLFVVWVTQILTGWISKIWWRCRYFYY